MVNIKEAARAAITAYGLATEQGGNASVPLRDVADSVASFYLANFTSFTLGGITTLENHDIATSGVLKQLQRLNQSGLGTDIRLCSGRVDVVSSQSALCWVTFEITPRTDKIEKWSWTNVYGFRLEKGRSNGLEGGWESTNADQEFQTLLERVPDFYAGGTV
ncbi:uncharacterized protein ColSpa_05069 [Colletotrichum spaethianum]|uniref:Uncharacterized protein n=1 Tax=Colletotrichum spaethianum TaxID=700344 RepID=A0AA37P1H2_9PEZI|nr:uncharacterized protein ColSpa_05069 [Colletotrichum spaethianum]GKT44888.1 hypothetical protein ColSpa_05069 [Colletotrichum spaethianum]